MLAVAAVVAAVSLVGTAGAGAPLPTLYSYGALDQTPKIVLRAGQALPGFTGGPVTAADGETVTVYVQDDLLAADPTINQHWADVLAGLLHGSELAKVVLYVTTIDRVREVCGTGALACYEPRSGTIISIGQDIRGITAQSVITHEYGHHVANNRSNDPWPSIDWGTKRWSSTVNVCKRAKSGELVPGDEGQFYQLNPGEVFAETYRVLNERRAGLPESGWEVVDPGLYPSQQALDALALDVTTPWAGNATSTYRAVMAPGASGRGFRLAAPNDGSFNATLRAPANSRFTLRVVDLTGGKELAYSTSTLRVKSVSLTLCGERSLQIQVRRVKGSGPFTLTVSKP
jgi:hypothetical protein